MNTIPEAAGLIAGFVLGHAVWNLSDLLPGELLVPLAVIEANGQRRLQRFEADTQEQAIASGKAAMRDFMFTSDAWAFARDGLLNEDGRKIDVVTVGFWATGMKEPASLLQKYQPSSQRTKFRLLGDPILVVAGVAQTAQSAEQVLDIVHKGIYSHSKVAPVWASWR